MLIEDFLSIDNFYLLFNNIQNYAREKYNYQFTLNDQNKKKIGKFMEVIYENNFDSMDKKTANAIVLSEFKKQIKKLSNKEFNDTEKIDKLDTIHEVRPLIDFNKPSSILNDRFNSIFKNQAKEIDSHFITEKTETPQYMFKDVLKSLEFKEHDLSKAPINEREQLLIPQPDQFKGMFDKPQLIENVLILLDSRDRNTDLYPDTENYSIKLDSVLKNVISIELIQAIVPNSDYLINDRNNTIYFEETVGTLLSADIPNGNYDSHTDIAAELTLSMNSVGDSNYTVTFDNNRYTIQSDRTGGAGQFLLKFRGQSEIFGPNEALRTTYLENSIGPVLGFNKIDLPNKASHTSQLNPNISSDRSIYMYINADTKDSFDNVEGLKTNDFGKFMKLALTSDFGEPTFWNNPRKIRNDSDIYETNKNQIIPETSEMEKINRNENDFKLYFNPPISINKLTIQFKNYFQQFFNFHGLEHSLFFRIEMFNFHYDNIIMDYNFTDLETTEELIEQVQDEIDAEVDDTIYLTKTDPDQTNEVPIEEELEEIVI